MGICASTKATIEPHELNTQDDTPHEVDLSKLDFEKLDQKQIFRQGILPIKKLCDVDPKTNKEVLRSFNGLPEVLPFQLKSGNAVDFDY